MSSKTRSAQDWEWREGEGQADFSVPDDQTWKQMVIDDLCGGKYEVNGAAVLNKLLLDFYHYLNTPALVKYLVDKCLLTDGERWALTQKPLSPQEKSLHLQQILMKKGENALIEFYQCLLESCGLEPGLAGHYTLVQIIKRKVRFHDCSDMAELLQQEREPVQVVRQIKVVPISSETARSLIQKLHLEECNIDIGKITTQDIAKHWLATDKTKNWKVLVEALLTERGCGCSVSGVLPLSESNPPDVWHFVRRLNQNWAHFAEFLGFPSRLICNIQSAWSHDPKAQIKSFMRMSLIPDCGDEKIGAIIQQIAHHMPVCRDPLISTKVERNINEDEKEDLPSEVRAPNFDGWGTAPGSVVVCHVEDLQKVIEQQKRTGASRVYQGGAALITGSRSDLYADDETVFTKDNSARYDTLHSARGQETAGESDLKPQDMKASELTVSKQQSLDAHSASEDESGRDILQACIHGSREADFSDPDDRTSKQVVINDISGARQMVVPRFTAGNQLQGGNSELTMQMQLIVNLNLLSTVQGASNLALPSATLKPGSELPLKMIPSISLNSLQQESEEMDGSNRSFPHVVEGSPSQKHLLKGDPQQEKHSQLLPEQISGPKQHSTNMPQTTELQRETSLPPLHERSQKVQETARNQDGTDAYDLLDANRKNDWELVEGLAESGSFSDASSQDGITPLMYACMQGQTKVVKRLVERGASVSTADSGGKTPLMYACISGKLELVKLVGREADVSATDHNGECCLHFPETLKNYKLVEYLGQVFTLLDRSLDIPSFMNKYTPLMVACTIGEDVAHTIKLLLERGANPNGNSEALRQPLIEASANGCTKVVQELLKHGANPNIQDASGMTALLEACQKKQLNMAIFLIEHGVSLDLSDNDGTTPLFSAVTTNSFVLIQKLIQKGAKVNTTRVVTNPVVFGSVEETPLSHACARGFLDITEYLIQNNANVNYLCGGTVSPLGHAIILNHMYIVKHLLKNKDLDKSPYGLSTSIIIAVKMDKYDCAGWLLDELGGAEAALQRAQQNGMFELEEHIQIHLAARKSLQPPPRGDVPVFQMPGNSHMMSIMQKFCSLCVEAAVNNADSPMPIENLPARVPTSVPTSRQSELSQFLYECINNKQNHETLIEDLLGGEYSAFKLLIQHKFLTMENFQIQACERCEDPQQFCKELVDIVRQLPDGKRLPQDPQRVLQYVFSGNMTFGVTAGGWLNPFDRAVGGAQMRQEDEHNPTAAWRQTSLPLEEKEQEQSPWKRSISASAHTGGWQFPGIGGDPVRQEHKHSLRHQASLPFEGREQEQRSWKKSISDSGNTGGATSQTGATSSQRETDHHKLSEATVASADTETSQEIRKLRPFIKKEAVLLLDNVLGRGAYGSVIEVKVGDKIYAGKQLRAHTCTDNVKFWKKFYTEYQVLDKLRHNHIVEYHGLAIVSDSDSPILIMEKLMANLEEFITNPSEYGRQNPDFRLKLSFLIGIADGLSYLHSKGVIHRDLTARNILLNQSLVAKISDFGNSAIVDIEPTSHLQTKSYFPGTLLYMPPEACESPSRYNTKLDVFSFGHLSLFVITNQRMNNVLASTFRDKTAPHGVGGRSEVERRKKYIDRLYEMIGQEHPLATLITSCLENFPEQRPSAIDVFTQLRKIYDAR